VDTDADRVTAWRIASQKLGAGRCRQPEQAVAWLGGIQAQDHQGAKWSIGLRTEGCTDREVEQAIRERRIVRTWMFRGTLHFVAAVDLSWLTSLLAPGIIRANARRYRQLDLDDASFEKAREVMREALRRNGFLTRAEIGARFKEKGVPAEGQQLPYLLQRAALDGAICQGPLRGKEPTYVLAADWAVPGPTLDHENAPGRLAGRYFASHGPATRRDFSWWTGLSAGQVGPALEGAPELQRMEVQGIEYWAAEAPHCPGTGGWLLPPFDEYLLGYKDRHPQLDAEHVKRINAGGGMPKPAVVVNGRVAGLWTHKQKKHELAVDIHPFRALSPAERELIEAAAEDLGRFMSMPVAVSFTPAD
jgi:hypothetical protein